MKPTETNRNQQRPYETDINSLKQTKKRQKPTRMDKKRMGKHNNT